MTKFLSFLFLTTIAWPLAAQDYLSDFKKYWQAEDSVKVFEILQAWEKASPEDPELYSSYFNYYFQMSKKEIVVMSTEQPEGEHIAITDSAGQTVGYMGSQMQTDLAVLQKGLIKIDKGIALYPDRLDFRFGKAYVFQELNDWDAFAQIIIQTIERSSKNKNNWLWVQNDPFEGGEKQFLLTIQDYQLDLYNAGDDALLYNMRQIALEVLKYYPDNVESLSNLSITYLLSGEYDQGIEALKLAEKIAPTDFVILANIAHGYSLKGDKKMALEYYKKVLLYGDNDAKAFAIEQMEKLEE